MKTSTVVLIGLGAAAVWYYANLGVAANTINFVVGNVNFDGLTTLTVNLTAQNVSNVDLKVSSMSGTVFMNGSTFANISDFTPVTVAANSQMNIPIVVKISVLSLGSNIMSLINSGSADFSVHGNANVNGMPIPFDTDLSNS